MIKRRHKLNNSVSGHRHWRRHWRLKVTEAENMVFDALRKFVFIEILLLYNQPQNVVQLQILSDIETRNKSRNKCGSLHSSHIFVSLM